MWTADTHNENTIRITQLNFWPKPSPEKEHTNTFIQSHTGTAQVHTTTVSNCHGLSVMPTNGQS